MNTTPKVLDDGVVRNSQSPDNACEIVTEDSCTAIQIQMSRNGQSRPGKRPIKNVSPSEKVDAIDRVHEGESKASVARDIGVPESTLRGWCKSEQKIRSQCNNASAELMARHSPVNIGGRSMSTNSRQSTGSRPSSNGRQSSGTLSEEDIPCSKRPKLERNGRQNSPQTVMAGPSTSSTSSAYMGRLDNRGIGGIVGRDPNSGIRADSYASLMASTMASTLTPEQQSQLNTLQQISFLSSPIAKNLLNIGISRGAVGLVENGLQYTRSGNNTFPSMVTTIANSIGIDNVRSTVNNLMGSAMGNAIDHSIGNRHAAVAPAQMTSRPYTRKSPSVSPAAEAPSTPVPASPNDNNAQPRQRNNGAHTFLTDEAVWLWMSQQLQEFQRLNGVTHQPVDNLFDVSKSWFWQWWKYCNFQPKDGSTEEMRAVLDYLFNNNRANNSSESESWTQSPSSLRVETASDRMESSTVSTTGVATADRATTTTRTDSPTTTTTTATTTMTSAETQEETTASSSTPLDLTMVLKSAKKHPSNAGIDEAIEHGTKLLEWLDNCSIPLLSVMQILRVKQVVDVLKWVRNSSRGEQSEVTPDPCQTPTGRNDKDIRL